MTTNTRTFGTYNTRPGFQDPLIERYRIDFPNGYGASIVRGRLETSDPVEALTIAAVSDGLTYGAKEGLWELAVFHNDRICYTTPITGDVIGYLTEDDVAELLTRIEALPPTTP